MAVTLCYATDGTLEDIMDSNQKFFPDMGYTSPRKIKGVKECSNPAFADHRLHRIGVFKEFYYADGLQGWSCILKCVNCGREVEKVFVPSVA